jgi:leucyl-tRNA synthetase
VQVNGKLRDRVVVARDLPPAEIERVVLEREKIRAVLGGREPARIIHVPGRLVNVVVR